MYRIITRYAGSKNKVVIGSYDTVAKAKKMLYRYIGDLTKDNRGKITIIKDENRLYYVQFNYPNYHHYHPLLIITIE